MNKIRFGLAFAIVFSVLTIWSASTYAASYVLIFSKDGTPVSSVSYNVDNAPLIRHLVYDLDGIGDSYNVYQGGSPIGGSPYTVDVNSSIYFETTSGGTFLITQGTPGPDTTPPSFNNITSNPSALSVQPGYNTAAIMFSSSEPLASNPTVKVGSNDAVFAGKTGNSYTYTYTANEAVDPETSVNITISGTDLADNSGSTTCSGCLKFDFTGPVNWDPNIQVSPN